MDSETDRTPSRAKVGCDQEVWLRDRILTAMSMAVALRRFRRVEADTPALNSGMVGIAEGTVIEIIGMLGMDCDFVNIRNPRTFCDIISQAIRIGEGR